MELRKLVASEGMVLTNGEVYSKEVYLGVIDKPENWYEITEEEYKIILEKEEQEAQELLWQ
jgi:hypothetical protein